MDGIEISAYEAWKMSEERGLERLDGVLGGGSCLHISHREMADGRVRQSKERSGTL